MNDNPQPEPQELTFGPITFAPSERRPGMWIVWDPGYSHITGHVLDMEELERLEALIQFIKNAPKIAQEGEAK